MKIAILSRGPGLYSTRRLREAAELAGHEVLIVDPLKCYMNIAPHCPTGSVCEVMSGDELNGERLFFRPDSQPGENLITTILTAFWTQTRHHLDTISLKLG